VRISSSTHTPGGNRTARSPRIAAMALVGCLALGALAPSAAPAAKKHKALSAKQVKQLKAAVKRTGVVSRAKSVNRATPLKVRSLRQVDLACVASFQFDFSPKLNGPQVSSQTTAALTGCVSPNSAYPNLLSAVLFADRGHSTARGCSPFPIVIDGVGDILWNDATSSDFYFRVNTNPFEPGFGLTANITGGRLAGYRISGVPLLILQDGLCGLGGINSLSVNLGTDIVTHQPT
jgi:hypothetical protein